MLKTIPRALAIILAVAGCLAGSGCLNLVPGDPPSHWNRDRCEDTGTCGNEKCAQDPYRPDYDWSAHRCRPHLCDEDATCAQGSFCGQEGVCLPFACHATYEACLLGKLGKPVDTCAEVCHSE